MAESGKAVHSSRNAEKRKAETLRRDILVLIYQFLLEEGFQEAAEAMCNQISCASVLQQYAAADNIDLPLILADFNAYYHLRFNKQPVLCKKIPENGQVRQNGFCPHNRQNKPSLHQQHDSNRVSTKTFNPNRSPANPKTMVHDSSTSGDGGNHTGSYNHNHNPPAITYQQQSHAQDPIRMIRIPKHLLNSDEDRELVGIISKDVIPFNSTSSNSHTRLDDIVGMGDAKEALEDAYILPLKHPDIYCGQPIGSVLFAGPPGTGKTMLARALGFECSRESLFFNVHASSLASKWRGDSEKLVRTLFEMAFFNAPAIVFIDEAESVLGERGCHGEHEASKRCKAEFLVQLDGLLRYNSLANGPVLFLASTNLPWTLDPAILRRFHHMIFFELPNPDQRMLIVQKCLKNLGMESKGLDFESICQRTDGFSGSDLQRGCANAAKKVLRRRVESKTRSLNRKQTKNEENSYNVKITLNDLKESLKNVRPLSDSWRKKYDKWLMLHREYHKE